MNRHLAGLITLGLSVGAILLATLGISGGGGGGSTWNCVFCGDRALADLLVNVLLFAPLGAGLGLLGRSPGRAALIGLAVSASVEFIQIVLPGRDASIGDVIANTAGAGIGAAVVLLAPWWLTPTEAVARRLALSWAFVLFGLFAMTGWLLAPSFPKTAYWGQWAPNLGHLAWYRGHVLAARVDGHEVRSRRVTDSDALRRNLLEGRAIDAVATAAPRSERLASIFSIYDENQDEIVLVGPDREDMVFRYRTRARDLRLDQPDLRLRSVLASVALGDTIRISVERRGRGYCMTVQAARECDLGFTVGDGWSLLLYGEAFPVWFKQFLGVGWLGTLLFPLGLWVRGIRDVPAMFITAAALAFAPMASTLPATPWTGWAAACGGLALGVLARLSVAASAAAHSR